MTMWPHCTPLKPKLKAPRINIGGTSSALWVFQRGLRGQILQPLRSSCFVHCYPRLHSRPTLWWSGCIGCRLLDPLQEAPLCTFILKLLNFRDRYLVLREARKIDVLRYEATKLMVFLDYSIDTQRQRRSFDHVKLNLRNKKIKYSMLFPARLWVQDGETTLFHVSCGCLTVAG